MNLFYIQHTPVPPKILDSVLQVMANANTYDKSIFTIMVLFLSNGLKLVILLIGSNFSSYKTQQTRNKEMKYYTIVKTKKVRFRMLKSK